MTVSEQNFDRIWKLAVTLVNVGKARGPALEESLEQVRELHGEEPSEEQLVLINTRFEAQLDFPPNPLTLESLLENTITDPDSEVDPTWVDDVESWPHLTSLRNHLDLHSDLTNPAKDNLEAVSLHILRHSPIPSTEDYHWRGLVMGNIQSGKTAVYTSLIARAFDAGYWAVFVLSGRLESLRKQTAGRLNDEIAHTSPEERMVRHYTEYFDWVPTFLHQPGFQAYCENIREQRTVWVVKKHASSLKNLNDFLSLVTTQHPELRDKPILIIDDESDEAGIDLGQIQEDEQEEEYIPREHSRVHSELRRLHSTPESGTITYRDRETEVETELRCAGFRRTVYIGFTATPYACCFTELNDDQGVMDEEIGRDMYPRDFMLVLDDPSNYCGGELFVGRRETTVVADNGEVELLLPSFEPMGNLVELPESEPCSDCMSEKDGNIHTHHRRNGHFINEYPYGAVSDICNCDCHSNDEIHRVRNPFRDTREIYEPELVDSLSSAIDRFILGGAARAQRGHGTKHTTMMVQVSNYTRQQTKLQELVTNRITEISDEFGGLGGHQTRLRNLWEDEYRPFIRDFDEGFEIEGAGNTTDDSSRIFEGNPVPRDCGFDQIEPHIVPFIQQIQHRALNTENEDNFLDYGAFRETGLKAVVYGGFSLGRGLTLKGLVSSYFARRPGDHSVGMQLQRWCGYRYVPGEDTLDLARVTMPMSLANGFNQMLSVELANRHSLDTYRREGVRPIEVGFRLQQTPGYPLVSEAKRGRMKVTMNPYSGREKSQTNHSLSTAELNQHTENWEIYRRFFETWSEGGGPASKDTDFLGQGLLFRDVTTEDIIELLTELNIQPHVRDGFSQFRIINYITRANHLGELTSWNVYVPSRDPQPPLQQHRYITSIEPLEYDDYDAELGEVEITDNETVRPFSRGLKGLADDIYRIGTLTNAPWRVVDLDQPDEPRSTENGLVIVVPVIHPFNREHPGIDVEPPDRINEGGVQWPAIPAISVIFPGDSQVRQQELIHEQFENAEDEDEVNGEA